VFSPAQIEDELTIRCIPPALMPGCLTAASQRG